MRIGQNPAKFVDSVPEPQRVTVAVISYIPFLSGYYAQGLEVLQACLGSLWANTRMPFDLLVFDQASCPEVRAYLHDQHAAGKIQFLVLSEKNLGKAAAWNFVFSAAPGEIIAYADADIHFEPGWLEALVGVLERYPQAGMVTGIPMWSPAQYSSATVRWAQSTAGISLQRGKLLPWEDYWQHARSLGQDEGEARRNFEGQEDLLIEDRRSGPPHPAHRSSQNPPRSSLDVAPGTLNTAQFFVGAGHFQFVARKSVLQEVLPIPAERPMGQVRRLDAAINERGYLRLSTPDWWVRHMGNTLAEENASDLAIPAARRPLRGPLRRLVQWLYHKAFELLYKS
jgi:hypothetical protein